jgi:hypothetical protein
MPHNDVTIFALLIFYKVIVLVIGLCFAYMGYKLFLADKVASAGDLTTNDGNYSISLRGGAPGVFFSLFGAIMICFSLLKGVDYKSTPFSNQPGADPIKILPDQLPSGSKIKK